MLHASQEVPSRCLAGQMSSKRLTGCITVHLLAHRVVVGEVMVSSIVQMGRVMYVDDYANHHIHKVTTRGQLLQNCGQRGLGQGQLYYPAPVVIDQRDR